MSDYDRLVGIKWNQNNSTFRVLNNKHLILNSKFFGLLSFELALLLLIIIGDYLIFDSDVLITRLSSTFGLSQRLFKALMDNSSHLLVGVLSWCIISYPKLKFYETLAVGFFSSIIDIDHFISAKSFQLLDAISLANRPFLHNSLTLSLINLGLFFYIIIFLPSNIDWALIFFISWFSHHIRDANRRGMWFGSVYTSSPISDRSYLLIIMLLPLVFRYVRSCDLINGYFLKFGNTNEIAEKFDSHIV